MKTLVVYYSRTGNTKKIAQDIIARLNAASEALVPQKNVSGFFGLMGLVRDAILKKSMPIGPVKENPAEYDLVILGTPVWGGTVASPVITYLNTNRGNFKKLAWFFSSGGMDSELMTGKLEQLGEQPLQACLGMKSAELAPSGGEAYEKKLDAFINSLR